MPKSTASDGANEYITLTDHSSGKTVDFPLLPGATGPKVFDIGALYKETGYFTYDPGYTCTGACESKMTFIDGEQGILMHRGYLIEDLAKQSDYMELCYMLLNDDLPDSKQKKEFVRIITEHSMVHEQLKRFYDGFRRGAHPMAIMCGVVGALSAFYPDSIDILDPKQRTITAHRLVAKMPTIGAMAYKYSIGQPFIYPRNDLNYAENFLHMMFAVPAEKYNVNPVIAKAMDRIFLLHADHEQNASTSTVRLAGSTGANPFASVAAGIAALWGPAHGGANEAVLNMLAEIGSADRISEYVEKAKDPNDEFRLFGFGHRVYKNYDPRAKVLQESCHEVLDALGIEHEPLLDIAVQLEEMALRDDYFIEKKLFPNVDFYSGIILKAIGMPTTMFTVLFAIARTIGWIAQWNEMIEDPVQKLGRPRQLYTGATERPVIPIHKRS